MSKEEEEECDDCNFTAGVSLTESVCNFFGKDDKEKCEEIVCEIKEGGQTFKEGLDKIENNFKTELEKNKMGLEFVDVMKKLAKEKGILDAKAKPQ